MDNQQTTAEVLVSKAKDEIIKEAKRIEEALLFSSKRHFVAADIWSRSHIFLGLPTVVLSAVAGASALAQFDRGHVIAGLLSIAVAVLTAVMTFLNPNAKASAHLNAGNGYDSLMNKVRIFWSVECWRDESEQVLTERLKYYSEQKDKLNQRAPQALWFAYRIAKRGIEAGEADYVVDKADARVKDGKQNPSLKA
jgi:hypothetical protein